jgi:FlaA1/EpsC-like NDP-sugar epimerase
MLNVRRWFIISYDFCTIPVAWLLAYWVRANFSTIPDSIFFTLLRDLPIVIVLQAISFWWFGLYRGQWRFASVPDLIRIIKASVIGSVLSLLVIYFSSAFFKHFIAVPPRSIFPLYCLLLVFLLGGARLAVRSFREMRKRDRFKQNVLIVGAGFAGAALIRELLRDHQKRYYPLMLVDDDKRKQGNEILGVRVMGRTKDIKSLVTKHAISQILMAIPSADASAMQRIVKICDEANIPFRTLPGLSDLATGDIRISDLREVSLEDLLGREPIDLHEPKLKQYFSGKRVLVTGGGGSIGSELCRQLCGFDPKLLVVIDQTEYNLYQVEMEVKQHFPNVTFIPYLLDVKDQQSVEMVFAEHKPDVVFHAAAYKHVPLLEHQLFVAIKNNVMGTKIVAQAASKYGASRFVLVSTDKAVNPTNIMGATKRIAEMYCQNLNAQSTTDFMTVRFGNVLGSAGSVVPLFKRQLKAGGPLTVTHPEITRFFMTIPEACQLILQASLMGEGGEIFVLKMGASIKISFLAEQMIKLSGKKVNEDIKIEYTGLRPGEKLYEELFHSGETLVPTTHEKISKANSRQLDWDVIKASVSELQTCSEKRLSDEALECLKHLVPECELCT